MKKKLTVVMLGAFVLGCFQFADGQTTKVPRVGYVSVTGGAAVPDRSFEALRQGLRDLGYVEGKNIAFEFRGAEGKWERIADLVTELVQLKLDLLFCPNVPAIEAAKQATKTIPIVQRRSGGTWDRRKLCAARREYNWDDATIARTERKAVELLKEIFPKP